MNFEYQGGYNMTIVIAVTLIALGISLLFKAKE
jgi:hypothetical protein